MCTSFTISLEITIFIALRCGNQSSERLWVISSHITIKRQTKDYQPHVSQFKIICYFHCISLTYNRSLIKNYQSTWNNLIFKTFQRHLCKNNGIKPCQGYVFHNWRKRLRCTEQTNGQCQNQKKCQNKVKTRDLTERKKCSNDGNKWPLHVPSAFLWSHSEPPNIQKMIVIIIKDIRRSLKFSETFRVLGSQAVLIRSQSIVLFLYSSLLKCFRFCFTL